ncbi:MAG TPA: heme-binding domain-containing protein [Caldilineaceae bacterium]|nr:heme-binding domain-containing protein [Caldilineaceae bacterium]
MRFRKRYLILGPLGLLILALIAIQFIPTDFSRDNPPVIAEPAWDSELTRALAVEACYDCHSNQTVWPWYSRIAPMSWVIEQDVRKGREALNFSEWTPEEQAKVDTEEMVELVSKGQMPLPYYNILHPGARLSESEKGQLITGLIATLEGGSQEGLTPEEMNQADEPGRGNQTEETE